MTHSEELDQLYSALAEFQNEVKSPEKDKTVKVKTRTGGNYSFQYATLGAILTVTKKLLASKGLSIIQMVDTYGVTLLLTHKSGQWLKTEPLNIPLDDKDKNDAQKFGSAVTYTKRYQYSAFLNIDADADDDGNFSVGNEVDEKETKKPAKKKPTKTTKKPETPKEKPTQEEQSEDEDSSDNSDFDQWLAEATDRTEIAKRFQQESKNIKNAQDRSELYKKVQQRLSSLK